MTSLFVSYSRKDADFAHKLTDCFKDQNWDFWIDWEAIPPTVDWWREVQKGIEQSEVFLFILSPNSARSQVCRQEVEHAVRNGKKMIPIVVREVDADAAPPELAHLNWIFFRESDNFEAAFEKLTTAIQTDYEWVQAHRELQSKALEWERSKRDKSFLLHGTELQAAEFQLDTNASKVPHPTALQKEYIKESRQAADRQRTTLYAAVITAGLVLAALAVFGWVQAGYATTNAQEAQTQAAFAHAESTRASGNAATSDANAQDAQRQAQIALVRQLGAQAVAQAGSRPDLGLLLAQESLNRQDRLGLKTTPENINSLLTTMLSGPRPLSYLHGHTKPVLQVAISHDSRLVASASADETIRIWDLVSGHPVFILTGHTGPVNSIDFSPNDPPYLLASGGNDGTVRQWRWAEDRQAPQDVILARLGTPVRAVAFSPNQKDLAVGTEDGMVRVYDLLTRQVKYTLAECSGAVTDLAFSADGAMLASADNRTQLCLWDMGTGGLINQPSSNLSVPDQNIHTILPSAPTRTTWRPVMAIMRFYRIVTIPSITILTYWSSTRARSSTWPSVTKGHASPVPAKIGASATVMWCTVWTCDSILYLKAHEGPVNSLAFSPDDRWLVSGGEDGNVLVWNAQFPYVSHSLVPPILYDRRYSAVGLVFSPDGKTLASSNWDGTIRLWDVESGSIDLTIPVNQGNQGMITMSPDGTKLAVAAESPAAPHLEY